MHQTLHVEMWIYVKVILIITILSRDVIGIHKIFTPFVDHFVRQIGDIRVESDYSIFFVVQLK